MSFLNIMKKAFGFGDDGESDDQLFADTTNEQPSDLQLHSHVHEKIEEPKPVEFDPQMQNAIFEQVVAIFNDALPEFISKAVDTEAQKQLIREALDSGVTDYLNSLNKAATEYCEMQWRARQNDMAAEMEEVRHRAREVERQSSDIQQKQLSADRQKRALTEKVHELESQMARLISENEQLQLENRSLLNRLKVSNVLQEDVDKSNAELQTLRSELNRLKEDPSLVSEERENALKAEMDKMKDGIDSLKEQLRVGDEIRDDLRRRLKDSEAVVAERDKEITSLNAMVEQFDSATAQFDELTGQLKASTEMISSLKKKVASRDEEIASLKSTISENIKQQAEREKSLKKQIEELRPPMVMSGHDIDFDDELTDDIPPRISEEDLNDIEESFKNDNFETKNEVISHDPLTEYELPEPAESEKENSIQPLSEEVTGSILSQNSVKHDSAKDKPEQLSLF